MNNIIFDWNPNPALFSIELFDETLRDGIQSPSVVDPSIKDKIAVIDHMEALGIQAADIGLPGAGPRAVKDVTELAKHVKKNRYALQLSCAARTVVQDIEPIARIQQQVGQPLTAYCFLGTSPIRQLVESWDFDRLLKASDEAIAFAIKENLDVAFVTEDTTRSDPLTLEPLFKHVIGLGCGRLVLCDTVGHASPEGVKALVTWTKSLIDRMGEDVQLDWHGHNDRGFGLINAFTAAQSGCHRIHGTCLGIGERAGNTAIDLLLVNLKLMGCYPHSLSSLGKYAQLISEACQVPIPANYPVWGNDAFKTATGVHAAAVIKAAQTGNDFLADTIYSGVPANWFGKKQIIEIGPMSGQSNVRYWLKQQGIEASPELAAAILEAAKKSDRLLSAAEIKQLIANQGEPQQNADKSLPLQD